MQPSIWSPFRQRFTLRQTVSMIENADSIRLPLDRVRRNWSGTRGLVPSPYEDHAIAFRGE